MVSLEIKHPGVIAQFLVSGNFNVKKTTRAFSAIAFDQSHEKNNATVKGDGGAVGLMENPAALRRWMVSRPALVRVIREFQPSAERKNRTGILYHQLTKHAHMAFVRDVKSLNCAIGEMRDPCCDESNDLLVLESRELADPVIFTALRHIEMLGQEQYERYVDDRLVNHTKPIADPIKRNNLSICSRERSQRRSFTYDPSRMTVPSSPGCILHPRYII